MVDNVCYLLFVFDLLQLFCVLFFPLSSLELIIIMNSILSPLLADLLQLLFRSSFQVYRIHLEPIAEYFHVIFYHFSNSTRAFSSVQFSLVAQSSLSITNSRSLLKLMSMSQWCHPAISSSVIPFSSCPHSLPASESFPMSQLSAWGGQSIGVSALASVLPMNTQDWSPLGWTGCISLQSKGLSRVFSNTTVQKHQFFGAQLSSRSNSHIHTWPLEKP